MAEGRNVAQWVGTIPTMTEAVIVATSRSPIGRAMKGSLVDLRPDDMSAHVRSVLTHSMLSIPVVDGRCAFGTWQGIYVWEHRQSPFRRRLTITIQGE